MAKFVDSGDKKKALNIVVKNIVSQSKNVVLLYHIFGTIGPDVFFF